MFNGYSYTAITQFSPKVTTTNYYYHYTIITNQPQPLGEHGDTDELVQYLEPLFLQYGVSAYFCGHDHITEHLSRNGIEYFVTGAGSMQDKIGQNVDSGAKLNYYLEYQSAFGVVEVTSDC